MSETALIEMPDGSPGAVSDAGTSLQRVSGGFERGGGVVARASSTVSAWEGRASVSFQGRAASYGLVMVAVNQALTTAQAAVRRYETALEDTRARIRQLREQEEMAVARLERAKGHLEDAKGRLAGAQQRMSVVSGASLSEPFSMSESIQAAREAADAQADIDAAQKQIDREREEIRELRGDARRERTQLIEAEQEAAGAVRSAAASLPEVQMPGGAASPSAYAGTIFAGPVSPLARDPRWGSAMAKAATEDEAEDDRAWYEKAPGWLGDQAVGVAKGFGEGVVGIGEGGLMLYRMSPTNALLDSDSFERQWEDTGRAAEFAWHNPGEFGKAVANWEDLSAGRYGEWVGGLGPDALLAVGTAGVGTAATRGLRGADALGDTADAARDADRVGDAARANDRAGAGVPGGSMTDAGARAEAVGDRVVRHWTPLDADRPLREEARGDTFRSSTYDEVVLGEDRLFHRDYSDPAKRIGPFWTREPSLGPTQSMLDSAILPEWGNTATESVTIRVPAGQTVFEGPAGPQRSMLGGGDQVLIPRVDPDWETGR